MDLYQDLEQYLISLYEGTEEKIICNECSYGVNFVYKSRIFTIYRRNKLWLQLHSNEAAVSKVILHLGELTLELLNKMIEMEEELKEI